MAVAGHHGHSGCHHTKDQIGVFKVGPLETNCYIYVSGNRCMIIGTGASGCEGCCTALNLELKYIVATHGHADHVEWRQGFETCCAWRSVPHQRNE